MSRLRISAISYLNTAPLMWDFEHGEAGVEAGREFDISYTLPSACARALEAGTADIGIIPAAAYAQVPGLAVLPGVAIASRRPVRSILLVSRVPVEQIRTVALDTSSMTSVALTKILFEKWLGGGRTFTSMPPDLEKMLAQHDAGLVIGDPALQIDRSRYLTLDLAEEWIRYTGKPFVFAFWAVRQQALENALCGDGQECLVWGQPPPAVRVAKRRTGLRPILPRFFSNPATTASNPQASTTSPANGLRASPSAKPMSAPISPKTSTTTSTHPVLKACNFSIAMPPRSERCPPRRRCAS